MSVSVIIPYYRRPVTLMQTLYSLSLQRFDLGQIEIIIVDDGSPEGERPDVSMFIDTLNIEVLYQADNGYQLSRSRNLGINSATHDHIILLDCDLAVGPLFIQRHLEFLRENIRRINIGLRDSRQVDDSEDPSVFKAKHPSEIGVFLKRDWRLVYHLDKNPNYATSHATWTLCSGGNIAFHKSVFQSVGPFDERFNFWGGEDTEWAYRAYKKGFEFHVDSEVHSYHFDCRSFEYQTDRALDIAKKKDLLRNLVPAIDSGYLYPGEVPYVSVFVTHYNKLEYLREALNSVVCATSTRFEIVLVDDCSDCTLVEIESQIPSKLRPKIRLFRLESHVGVEKCYAYALNKCRGEFIAQLDADDYLLPNAIDKLIDHLKVTDSDLAYGKYKVLKNGELRDGWTCKDATRDMRILSGMYYHPLRVFRARALNLSGGMRTLGLEAGVDFSLYSQIEIGSKATFCDVDSYVYREVENSITSTRFDDQVRAVETVVNANAEIIYGVGGFKLEQVALRQFRTVPK